MVVFAREPSIELVQCARSITKRHLHLWQIRELRIWFGKDLTLFMSISLLVITSDFQAQARRVRIITHRGHTPAVTRS